MLLPTFLQNSDLKKTIMEQFPGMSLVSADQRHYDEENGRSELQRCSIKGSRYSGFSSLRKIFTKTNTEFHCIKLNFYKMEIY